MAVLASPRFLFRQEVAEPYSSKTGYPFIDQYSLASRLSYLLWSSTPDDELLSLAAAGELRNSLSTQIARMLKDGRSDAFMHNFTGQWLRTRDIDGSPIDANAVLAREAKFDPEPGQTRGRFRQLSDRPPASLSKEEKAELAVLRARLMRGPRFAPEPN